MSEFKVPVCLVTKVEQHPNREGLSLVHVNNQVVISSKLDDGSYRYKEGQMVFYVPEGAIVPQYLLKQGYWNEERGKGLLGGNQGNRVKAIKLGDVVSIGIIFPVETYSGRDDVDFKYTLSNEHDFTLYVEEGDDVADFLGIEEYVLTK
jgi:hypothetical protein